MAKLTRTQKYADLRETLANDKEPSLSTNELSNYEEKLTNMTGYSLYGSNTEESRTVPEEDQKYVWTDFDDSSIENYSVDLNDSKSGSDFFNDELYVWNDFQEVSQNKPAQPEVQSQPEYQPQTLADSLRQQANEVPQPVKEEENVASFYEGEVDDVPVEPAYTQPTQQFDNPATEEPQYMGLYNANSEVEEAYKEAEKRQADTETKDFDSTLAETLSVDKLIEDSSLEKKVTDNNVNAYVSNEPLHASEDRHAVEHTNDTPNTIINETINEVGEYNRSAGEQTITQLTNNMVNEVRRRESRLESRKYTEVPVSDKKQDEEFSNTVSMEINKVMDEISNTQEISKAAKQQEKTIVSEKPVEEKHPVLTKKLEEEKTEDVVEIKNIAEIKKEVKATNDTISGTIPFVVSASGDEELIDGDVEEDSNTILNIILVVLIIILVALLGLIVFYILKTKGIIP